METDASKEWFDIGFTEGASAGLAEIGSLPLCFDPQGSPLAIGHALLDGSYNVVRRSQSDFPTFRDGASWMSGVYAGVASVQAFVGYVTGADLPSPQSDGNTTVFVLITHHLESTATH